MLFTLLHHFTGSALPTITFLTHFPFYLPPPHHVSFVTQYCIIQPDFPKCNSVSFVYQVLNT